MSASCEASIVLPTNLHARPAGRVAQAVARFQAQVEISYGQRIVNARGVLGVMGLGATAGAMVTLRATGEDAAEAIATLAAILATPE